MNRVSDNPTTTPHLKRIATALGRSPEAGISTFSWIQHASQEAARVLIPPTPCPCPLDPSITSTTLQALPSPKRYDKRYEGKVRTILTRTSYPRGHGGGTEDVEARVMAGTIVPMHSGSGCWGIKGKPPQ